MTPKWFEIRDRHRQSHNDDDEMQPQDDCDTCDLLTDLTTLEALAEQMGEAEKIINIVRKYRFTGSADDEKVYKDALAAYAAYERGRVR